MGFHMRARGVYLTENHIDRLDGLVAALTRVVAALERRLGKASEDKNEENLSIEARLAILRERSR